MTSTEIHAQLRTVFRNIFDQPQLEISDSTTAADIDDWDSISHISLIAATEKAFRVSFTTKDVKALANVGDFVRLISSRTK
jgi:acyl carrier protein